MFLSSRKPSTSLVRHTFGQIKTKGGNHRDQIDKGNFPRPPPKTTNNKVTSFLVGASIEQLRMGTGGVCARQDNTQEWHSVIEISIKEVISGVIAEVL